MALAVTLTSLCDRTFPSFRVIVFDQTEEYDVIESRGLKAVLRVLEAYGRRTEVHKHLPRRGMGEQRQSLLDKSRAPHVPFIDDDIILEPYVIERMYTAFQEECGFAGSAIIGLSYLDDVRPDEQDIEFRDSPVVPETVMPGTIEWDRHPPHNAGNLYHLRNRLGLTPKTQRKYKVAQVGGCVMYELVHSRCERPANLYGRGWSAAGG